MVPQHAAGRDTTAERYLVAFRYTDQTASFAPGWTERVRHLVVPLWPGVALFGLAPAMFLGRRVRARRRARRGHCSRCGYDLRATKARCPECGTRHGEA